MATQDSNSMANGTRMQGSEIGENSFISGINNAAMAPHSTAIGSNNKVEKVANSAVALGDHTIAYSPYQLVHGKYNDLDANNIYAHIVGGGTDENEGRKNIYTLDWEGNATFAGKVSFAQDVKPTEGNDLVNLDYLNEQIAIKYFPHTLSADGSKSTIYVNDLDAYTIYKVKQEGQKQILFSVKTESGRDVTFYVADLSINRHNMFVGEKTTDSITFFMDSSIYTINLKTGKLTIAQEEVTNSGSGSEGSESTTESTIKDDDIGPNITWSSSKIFEMLNALEMSVNKSVNRIELSEPDGLEEYIKFYNNDDEIYKIELPYVAWKLTEDHVKDWNRVQLKITAPNDGDFGKILMYNGYNEQYIYSNGTREIAARWTYPYDEEYGIIKDMTISEEEKQQLMGIFEIIK